MNFGFGSFIKHQYVLALLLVSVWFPSGLALAALPGDCDSSGVVSIPEAQSAVNMFLGLETVAGCVDTDGSGTVAISEVQMTVNALLRLIDIPAAKQVTGFVRDPSNKDAPLSGVTVRAYVDGTSAVAAATTTTTSTGSFSFSGLVERSYYLVFIRTGYGIVKYYDVKPTRAADTVLAPVRLLPSALLTQTADINGYVRNAADNSGLKMRLEYRPGIGNKTGAMTMAKTTDNASGYYTRTLDAGAYTVAVVDTSGGDPQYWKTIGHFTVYAVPGVAVCNNSQNFSVMSGTAEARYRVELSWGSTPTDFDLHLTGPLAPGDLINTWNEQPRFHLGNVDNAISNFAYPYGSSDIVFPDQFAAALNVPSALTDVFLDIDQIHGYDNGPETATILSQRTGIYRCYVYNNSVSSGNLASSKAQVKLYKGDVLLQTFAVPAQSGTTWKVFELSGSTITSVNTISSTTTDALAKLVPGSFDETSLFQPIDKSARRR